MTPAGQAVRRDAEAALHESEARCRHIVDGARDYAIVTTDPDGRIESWSPGAEAVFGWTAAEAVGRSADVTFTPEDRAAGVPAAERAAAGAHDAGPDVRWHVHKSGGRVFIEGTTRALRDEAGAVRGYVKIGRDVTRRHRLDEALRASEARFRAVVEQIEDYAIFGLDAEGCVTEWTSGAERVKGYAPAEIVGRHVSVFYIPEEVAAGGPAQELAEAAATGRVEREGWRVRGDGTRFWGNEIATAIYAADGRVVGFTKISRDLTQRRAVEQALRDALAAAEEARRAAEVARAEAEAASRAKGEFLAVMSHELRTPLQAISGYAELMAMGIRGPVTDQQRADLARIRQSQDHLLGLINEVLDYVKLGTGTVHFEVVGVRACDALAAAEALVAPQARAKGLTLTSAGCASDVAVRADPVKLRQVLVNLLSNAVKFTDRGGRIDLECEVVAREVAAREVAACEGVACAVPGPGADGAADRRVRLTVRDTGTGIPADQLERIFEPFVQVRTGLTREHDGTGLGLAISRDLVRGMGGDLTAGSEVGVGSTFTLTLPAA